MADVEMFAFDLRRCFRRAGRCGEVDRTCGRGGACEYEFEEISAALTHHVLLKVLLRSTGKPVCLCSLPACRQERRYLRLWKARQGAQQNQRVANVSRPQLIQSFVGVGYPF